MTDDTYNGFTNRETWAVKLHIDNTYEWHHISMQLAAEARTEALEGTYIGEGVGTIYRKAEHVLADNLKDWITTYVDTFWQAVMERRVPQTSNEVALMIQDVGSFERVNWDEVARTLLEDEPEVIGE